MYYAVYLLAVVSHSEFNLCHGSNEGESCTRASRKWLHLLLYRDPVNVLRNAFDHLQRLSRTFKSTQVFEGTVSKIRCVKQHCIRAHPNCQVQDFKLTVLNLEQTLKVYTSLC